MSLWVALGPALSTVGIGLSLADGDTSGPRWVAVLLLVCGAAVVVTVVVLWWRTRGMPKPPLRPSTSRWTGGRPEERWH